MAATTAEGETQKAFIHVVGQTPFAPFTTNLQGDFLMSKIKPFMQIIVNGAFEICVFGRAAQTLHFLIEVAEKGATRLEFTRAKWARATSQYVARLRELGISIESPLEEIEPKVRVSRYRLLDDIEILKSGGL